MKTIVVLQPQFLPWLGTFEQIAASDIYVHYDDVQMPINSNSSSSRRVEIKTSNGLKWLTTPIQKNGVQLIKDVLFDSFKNWKLNHLDAIKQNYSCCKYFDVMFPLINDIYAYESEYLSEFNIHAMETLARAIGIKTKFMKSSEMGIGGSSTAKLLDIMKCLNGNVYITGHGAKNYFDHMLFEENGIDVKYIDYACKRYEQPHDDFTPYVSVLDAIANLGLNLEDYMVSKMVPWREFINKDKTDNE